MNKTKVPIYLYSQKGFPEFPYFFVIFDKIQGRIVLFYHHNKHNTYDLYCIFSSLNNSAWMASKVYYLIIRRNLF